MQARKNVITMVTINHWGNLPAINWQTICVLNVIVISSLNKAVECLYCNEIVTYIDKIVIKMKILWIINFTFKIMILYTPFLIQVFLIKKSNDHCIRCKKTQHNLHMNILITYTECPKNTRFLPEKKNIFCQLGGGCSPPQPLWPCAYVYILFIYLGMYFIDKITWLFSAKIKLNS